MVNNMSGIKSLKGEESKCILSSRRTMYLVRRIIYIKPNSAGILNSCYFCLHLVPACYLPLCAVPFVYYCLVFRYAYVPFVSPILFSYIIWTDVTNRK